LKSSLEREIKMADVVEAEGVLLRRRSTPGEQAAALKEQVEEETEVDGQKERERRGRETVLMKQGVKGEDGDGATRSAGGKYS
jgi:hypothetical protein